MILKRSRCLDFRGCKILRGSSVKATFFVDRGQPTLVEKGFAQRDLTFDLQLFNLIL